MNLMFDAYSSWRIVTWWYEWVGGGTPWRITWSTTDPWKCSSTSAWCPESHTMWATSTSTSSPSTSPMPRWPVSTMGTSTERWVHLYTKCIMGLAHRVMYIHIVSWACSLREVCKQCNMGMPTERWKLIGVHIQSVLWACPFFDTQRSILFIYSIDCCCIHFESGCACFWRYMGQRNAFTLFIKHLFCSQYLIELYLEFIGFLGLLLFFPIYSWLFKCICKGCEEFFFLGIICIYSAVVIVAQVTHSYLILERYSLSLYMYYIVYYFQYICTTKMHGLPVYYPYVLYQLATKTFCLWF